MRHARATLFSPPTSPTTPPSATAGPASRCAATPTPCTPALPFKLNQDRRHHIPKQKRKVVNWRDYDASLRQRGSLTVWFTTVWFTAEAVEGWRAEPRTSPGGQAWYSPLAILTALTLGAVFRLALRQAEGLIGSVIGVLGLTLRVPDHSTLSRRAATLQVPWSPSSQVGEAGNDEPMHLLVDSTGLRLCGAGEWLIEKHGTHARRSWRKLHIGLDAATGEIVASALTDRDVDDAARVGPLLDQVAGAVAVVVPPRSTAVPSDTAASAPTQRDRHLRCIAEHGRMAWQKTSSYNIRARAEAAIGRFKRVIGDGLRSRNDERRASEVAVAVHALNRMLALGHPISVRIA